jgi:hypothetical protein
MAARQLSSHTELQPFRTAICRPDGLFDYSYPSTRPLIFASARVVDAMVMPVSLVVVSILKKFSIVSMSNVLQVSADGLHDKCYWPNGDVSPKDSACTGDGSPSACCPMGWECLSNNLCYSELAKIYERTSCTDMSWEDTTCLGMCTKSETHRPTFMIPS